MIRIRSVAFAASLAVLGLAGQALEASAAAEIHRLNLMISANPTSIAGGGFNEYLDDINQQFLVPLGWETIKEIKFGWSYEAELRYFVRPNVAIAAGVGTLNSTSKREFLPALQTSINLQASVETTPIHVGAAYYLAPYNQGDFQARTYIGAGLVSAASTQVTFMQDVVANSARNAIEFSGGQSSPGYYLETGAHMFFASRWSVVLGGVYRDVQLREIQLYAKDLVNPATPPFPAGQTSLDLRGGAVRMAVLYGF